MHVGRQFNERDTAAVEAVLRTGLLWRGNGAAWSSQQGSGGSAVDAFEDAFRECTGAPYVLAVNSGSSANEAMVASLGLLPGDEVVCPAASPIFVPLAVIALGCIPVFADVDPQTMLIDPERIESVVSPRTRAVVAVHLWGQPAPMKTLVSTAGRLGLRVVEDCAQALATRIDGQLVGSFGEAACYSLQQSKHITSGEGGLLTTPSPKSYALAVLYSNSGIPSFRYGVTLKDADLDAGLAVFGHNHRMSELQAAVASVQLERLDDYVARRAELTEIARNEVASFQDFEARFPPTDPTSTVSYWRFPILVPPGRGNYIGIPQLEPIFRRMEAERVTPLGVPLPEHIHYGPSHCAMAILGATQLRVIPFHHSQSDEQVRTAIREGLR